MIALSLFTAYLVAEVVCRMADRLGVRWLASAYWEGTYYQHKATSRADALEWAACYPNNAACCITRIQHGNHDIIASRRRTEP